MLITGSLAIVLSIIVILLIRRNSIRPVYALICVLAGFEIASTSIAPTIGHAVGNVVGWFGELHL